MAAQMTTDGTGVLPHANRHGKEIHLSTVLLVSRFQLRRQRFAVLTPNCPELQQDWFLAEVIGQIGWLTVDIVELYGLGHRPSRDTDLFLAHQRLCRPQDAHGDQRKPGKTQFRDPQ